VLPSWVWTVIEDAPETTWALVAISPLLSISKPVPCASWVCCVGPNGVMLWPVAVSRTLISTTPETAPA
jgi:hypothetical protein